VNTCSKDPQNIRSFRIQSTDSKYRRYAPVLLPRPH
jgi:hypothetical protein